jgi:hypothetical protein
VVVGIGVPRPVDLEGAGGLAAGRVAQVGRDAAELVRDSSVALNGARSAMKPMVEFWPPPGITNRGKPAPASW